MTLSATKAITSSASAGPVADRRSGLENGNIGSV
jgi:hypothetical protein